MPATIYYRGRHVGAIQALYGSDQPNVLKTDMVAFFKTTLEAIMNQPISSKDLEDLVFDIALMDPVCPHGDSMQTFSNCQIKGWDNVVTSGSIILFEKTDLTHG